MIRGIAAAASDPTARAAAEAALAAGGSAADAVIAGFFAAAGAHPTGLFAPAVAVVSGTGAGARVFDGRSAEPGRSAPRPRGFARGEVPISARAAVPRAVSMLVLLHARLGRLRLAELARAGIDSAEEAGSKPRALLLRSIGQRGATALGNATLVEEIGRVAGPLAGGVWSVHDLAEAAPADVDASVVQRGTVSFVGVPFAAVGAPEPGSAAVVAVDARGLAVALTYVPTSAALLVPSFEVNLDVRGIPVRRGVTRTPPGAPLPMAAPCAVVLAHREGSLFRVAVAMPGAVELCAADLLPLVDSPTFDRGLSELAEKRGGLALAALGEGSVARSFSVGH